MNNLKNSGIEYLGKKNKINNIIIVGVARSGTSLVAGVLNKLGVFTGKKSIHPVYEDVYLAEYIESNNFEHVKKIIKNYTNNNKIWAFKRPSIINYLEDLHNLWINPYYIFIFKDLVSIANRNKISMKIDFITNLINTHNEINKIINFIDKYKFQINGMFLSYEKIILNPKLFVEELINTFNLSNENKYEAIKFISINPKDYLDNTRIDKTNGIIDIMSQNLIKGWAKYVYKNEPVEVGLYINDKLVSKTIANKYRKDLEKIHPSGKCSFIFELKDIEISPKDKIEIKTSDGYVLKLGKRAKEFFVKNNIDLIEKNRIAGWICDLSRNEPVEIGLYINDKLVSKTIANKYRKDLEKIHLSGKCSFIFELKDIEISSKDKIEIKTSDGYVLKLGKRAKEFFVKGEKGYEI